MQLVLIAVAGALGALARYGVGQVAQPLGGAVFPASTLIVNLTGAFLLGFLGTTLLERTTVSSELRAALTIGFLGAYTTFSTFSLETFALIQDGEWAYALANVGVSVIAGLACVWAGQQLARV